MLTQVRFWFGKDIKINVEVIIKFYQGKLISKEEIEDCIVYLVELDLIELQLMDNKFKLEAAEKYDGWYVNTDFEKTEK